MTPTTMKRIAADLGLSITTISKVLNHHADIGQATRARVLKRVEELGYRPNAAARSLSLRRTNTVGIMILVAGPYRSDTGDDPNKMAANVRMMEAYALPLFRAGHIPVVGEWFALPLVALAGSRRVGDAAFNEVFHPIAERLLQHCDAVLRVGGASQGADLMVRLAQDRGLKVYRQLRDIPGCESAPEPNNSR